MNNITYKNKRIILAGLFSAKIEHPEKCFNAIEIEINNQGGKVVGKIIQRKGISRSKSAGGSKRLNDPMHPATFMGKGKIHELRELYVKTEADFIIFLNKLSISQIRRLESMINCIIIC